MKTITGRKPLTPDKVIITFQSTAGGSVSDGVLIVPTTDTPIAVNFMVSIKDPGAYTLAAPKIQGNPGSLWRAQLMGPATINTAAANTTIIVRVGLRAKPGACPTNLLVYVSSSTDIAVFGKISLPIRT